MSADGNGVPSEPISDRTRHEDEQRRGTRLYTFPGGVFEVEESLGDTPGTGVYLEFYQPRQSCNDARAFGPGEAERLRLVDNDSEHA
jgi:hypothetical protein